MFQALLLREELEPATCHSLPKEKVNSHYYLLFLTIQFLYFLLSVGIRFIYAVASFVSVNSSSLGIPPDPPSRPRAFRLLAPPSRDLPGRWLFGPCLHFGYLRPLRTAYSGLRSVVGIKSVQPTVAAGCNSSSYFLALVSNPYTVLTERSCRLLRTFVFARRQHPEM